MCAFGGLAVQAVSAGATPPQYLGYPKGARIPTAFPRPLKGSKKWNPKYSPSFPNVVMGSYWGVPLFGSFRGSGSILRTEFNCSCEGAALNPGFRVEGFGLGFRV